MESAALLDTTTRIVHHRGRGLSAADLEDVVQDVVHNYCRRWPDGQEPVNVEAWLETAARNRIVDHHRAVGRHPVDLEEFADDDPVTLMADLVNTRTPSLAVVRSELVASILQELPADQADVIRRRYLDGWSAAHVAKELGISPAAVDQRASRARRTLQEALERRPDLAEELRRKHPRPYRS